MTAVEGESNLVYADINDGHTSLCFYRANPEGGGWWNQTQDWGTIGTYNRFKIRNFKGTSGTDEGKYCWAESGAAIRWTPGVAIDGLVDVNNPHNQAFSFTDNDGTYSVTLSAHTTYQFKILDGSTAYGLDNNVWTSSISNYTLNTSGYALRLCTAGAGTYTFAYNKSTHKISVTYPTVSHPNIDYCYLKDYTATDWSNGVYIHFKDPSTSASIAGTTWCGTEVPNKVEIGTGNYYFYYSPGDYPYFNLNEKGDGIDQTGDRSANWGKYLTYNECTASAWDWCTFTVRIQLENEGATTTGTEYQDIAFNSGVLSDITCPTKTHYDFQGYYTEDGGTGTQVIDKDGHWLASVADYTDASKHWIHAGTTTTLYAKWTEIKHDVTVAVSPAEAGSVQVGGSPITKVENIGYETHSPMMTAVPANAAWVFKEWQVTSNAHLDLLKYSETGTTMEITATDDDQTLTAVFEPRFYLVGGEIMSDDDETGTGTESGMPGWGNYNKPFEIVTNSPILATCSLTLGTNKNFYIMVRDKADGLSYGKSGAVALGDGESITFVDKDNRVFFYSNGGDNYTFKITAIDGSGRPTVSVERPYQVNIGRKRVDIDGKDHDDNTGGTVDLSMQTAPDTWTPISNAAWVPYGASIKYNASKEDGYNLAWFTASDYNTQFSTEAYWFHTATSTGNGYAKFTEISTSVTLANDGNGKVQIGGADATNTTCGVTTTRSLTAVPDDGYMFTNWTTSSDPDFGVDDDDNTSVTLTGHGTGTAGTLTANFEERYSIKGTMDAPEWGTDHIISNYTTNASGDVIGYVDITLSANTNYEFAIYDKATSGWLKNNNTKLYYMTNGNSHVWDFATGRTYNCGITTAGAGTYRFYWNVTDKTMSVTYPNFVIYRSGDKAGDSRATGDDVESYDGGTISQAIEYRMKVNALDTWYSLCLPFTVTAVKVWDEEDGRYYDILPYYRTEVGATLKDGHYYIRTPKQATNFSISEFSDWRDPANSSFIPVKNTPYIIRWHKSYFSGRYVSFFSATGETIPTAMSSPGNPNENTVNVCVNNAMIYGSVAGAYMLENDYGNGAWLRLDDATEARAIPPFECYIVGASGVLASFPRLRGDMTIDNNTTDWETVSNPTEGSSKVLIDGQLYIIRNGEMYTIQGFIAK